MVTMRMESLTMLSFFLGDPLRIAPSVVEGLPTPALHWRQGASRMIHPIAKGAFLVVEVKIIAVHSIPFRESGSEDFRGDGSG